MESDTIKILFIVDCLKSDTTAEDIVVKLCEEYEVAQNVAARDVEMIIEKLNSIGALE